MLNAVFPSLIVMLVESTTKGCCIQYFPQWVRAELSLPPLCSMINDALVFLHKCDYWQINHRSWMLFCYIFFCVAVIPDAHTHTFFFFNHFWQIYMSQTWQIIWENTILFMDFTYKVYCIEKIFTFVKSVTTKIRKPAGNEWIKMRGAPFTTSRINTDGC